MGSYLVVAGGEQRAVTGDTDAGDGHVIFGNQLVGTFVVAEIPDHDDTATIGADQFTLVRVDDNIVDRMVVVV